MARLLSKRRIVLPRFSRTHDTLKPSTMTTTQIGDGRRRAVEGGKEEEEGGQSGALVFVSFYSSIRCPKHLLFLPQQKPSNPSSSSAQHKHPWGRGALLNRRARRTGVGGNERKQANGPSKPVLLQSPFHPFTLRGNRHYDGCWPSQPGPPPPCLSLFA